MGAAIEIDKRIPVAAGMGGGSADAAATLRVLNELWSAGLDEGSLAALAEGIGSDRARPLRGRAGLRLGRGEHIVPVPMPSTYWVICPFPFGVRTPDAFAWWDLEGTTGPDPAGTIAAAEAGNAEALGSSLFNDLQKPVLRPPSPGRGGHRRVPEAGALGAVMTGSGPRSRP